VELIEDVWILEGTPQHSEQYPFDKISERGIRKMKHIKLEENQIRGK